MLQQNIIHFNDLILLQDYMEIPYTLTTKNSPLEIVALSILINNDLL